MSYCKRNKNL